MTDNEIIKALECLRGNAFDCGECPYCSCYPAPCEQQVAKDALSLITRQKEGIEWLKNRDLQVEVSEKLEREIKSEAVKEFAEKVKETSLYEFIEEYFENAELCYEARQDQFCEHIDNLVKEMVGENNA